MNFDLTRVDNSGVPCVVQRMEFRHSDLMVSVLYFDGTNARVGLEHLVHGDSYTLFTESLTDAQWKDAETWLTAYWYRSTAQRFPETGISRRWLRAVQ